MKKKSTKDKDEGKGVDEIKTKQNKLSDSRCVVK